MPGKCVQTTVPNPNAQGPNHLAHLGKLTGTALSLWDTIILSIPNWKKSPAPLQVTVSRDCFKCLTVADMQTLHHHHLRWLIMEAI